MERPGEQKRGEAAAGMANEFGLVRPVVAMGLASPCSLTRLSVGSKLLDTPLCIHNVTKCASFGNIEYQIAYSDLHLPNPGLYLWLPARRGPRGLKSFS